MLSGLSPITIMECAGRALAFHAYQTSQEIIYQEHLAKGLTEKYNTLSQQMDQLIHDANAQIKALQDKMQAMQTEQASLEAKNHELVAAFKEKTKSQQQTQKLYQSLKAQVMASHIANVAGNEAEFTLQTARGDRIDRLPGTRTSTTRLSQIGVGQQTGSGRPHNRVHSRISASSGRQEQSGIGFGQPHTLQGRGFGNRTLPGQSALVETPSLAHRSRLPVLGGTRQKSFLHVDAGSPYQASPLTRQPLVSGRSPTRNLGSFALGSQPSRMGGRSENTGLLGR